MRLIDADELKDWSEIVPLTGDGGIDINDFDEKLKSMPTVDAVPVIRCKDCKFSKAYYHGSESNLGMFTYLCTQGLCKNADDYCSRAERKDNGESN